MIAGSQWGLGLNTGLLFGVPIPKKFQVEGENIQKAVEQAIEEADQNGMSTRGKEVTPWLLRRVGELTEGESLKSSKYTNAIVSTYSYPSRCRSY